MNNEMNFYIYNEDLELIGVIEDHVSLVWSDRYDEIGDFELVIGYDFDIFKILKKDLFCSTDYSKHWGIIEKIEMGSDDDGNRQITVSGRMTETILERRIIVNKIDFGVREEGEYLQYAVKTILDDNVIEPNDSNRRINNFIFQANNDPAITSLIVTDSFDKTSVFDAIKRMCDDKRIGFSIIVNDLCEFVFSLYRGADKSNTVIFSPYLDNLNNSKYFTSSDGYSNVMYVSKKDDNYLLVANDSKMPYGILRREIHENESTLKENEQEELTDDEITARAVKKLRSEHAVKTGFEGDIIPDVRYVYLRDYNVGDMVTLEDEFGNSEVVYISEVVITHDENGLSIIPTFKEIDW